MQKDQDDVEQGNQNDNKVDVSQDDTSTRGRHHSLDHLLSPATCCFRQCSNEVAAGTDKCERHKYRVRCFVSDCANQVYAHHLCVRHGGKRTCQHPGCAANVRAGGLCSTHSDSKPLRRRCSEGECLSVAHASGRCVRHGGGQLCSVDGCAKQARAGMGGRCYRHNSLLRSQST
ncbi:Aste57867_23496 [Aphanomyces stellatus]|uniref:Aste57867_23496 protein n=1 Tax=Aphanomyces stellatus TaxID=120398 RepID=A0A485LMT4_9STRA|nr:hypothetical protein As57867_023425 [Aphanomyces stellatus]VFU00141.1 Aste57867_23496 [Aphanomyces stellatus]